MEFAAWDGKRSWRKEEMVDDPVDEGGDGVWMWGSRKKRELRGRREAEAETSGGMSEYKER